MLEIWDRMETELRPNARLILTVLGYYAEHDLLVPDADTELSKEEQEELTPIVRVLMDAAMKSEKMRERVLAATLKKIAKGPALFFSGKLPAAAEWEIASDYQRGDEKPGTFCMDVWGDEQTACSYVLETPEKAEIAKAAEAAGRRIQDLLSPGRPRNAANRLVAERMGDIFRRSGQPIVRRLQPEMRHDRLVFVEAGPFCDFLNLVLGPLQRYLSERKLPPVTVESVVRFATEEGL
jgi:hypothetical protein